jgi:hypothetical protein
VTAEELFQALDGRVLLAPSGPQRVEVFSVRDEAGVRWVQLALKGEASRKFLTVSLKLEDTAHQAISTLSAWLTDPTATNNVFNVA